MNFLVGLLLSILGYVILGAFGMVAWNMCIPVIFEGPKITIIHIIVIAMVLGIRTSALIALEDDEEKKKNLAVTTIARFLKALIISPIMLIILWVAMQIAY